MGSDGSLLPPDASGTHTVRGNLESATTDDVPPRGANPIAVPSRGLLLFVDDCGETHVLATDRELVVEHDEVQLRARGGGEGPPFILPTQAAPFVPRAVIVERVVLTVWPVPPFGPWRLGRPRPCVPGATGW